MRAEDDESSEGEGHAEDQDTEDEGCGKMYGGCGAR